MRLDSIAYKSLVRRRTTMAFLVLGVVVAITTAVSLYTVTAAMKVELADTFDEIGANIMVLPGGDQGSLAYGGVVIPGAGEPGYLDNDAIIAINTIKNRDNIAVVAPKVLGLTTYQGQNLTVVGVDFPYELALKRWWRYDGETPARVDDLLLGSGVAARLGLKPGSTITLGGRDFRVAAVLESQGNEEDGLVFMNLLPAQTLLGKENRLSFIEVAAYCTTCPIEQIVAQIQDKLPGARVTAVAEAVRARQEVVDSFVRFALAVGVIVVAIAALVIMLSQISAVNQRTVEIGTYRAMGFRRRHVLEVILTEAAIVGLAGGLVGYVAGTMVAQRVGPAVARMQLDISWNPLLGGLAVLAAAAVALLASIYPAVKAARLDPAEALRYI